MSPNDKQKEAPQKEIGEDTPLPKKDTPLPDDTFSFDFIEEKFAEDKQVPAAESPQYDKGSDALWQQ